MRVSKSTRCPAGRNASRTRKSQRTGSYHSGFVQDEGTGLDVRPPERSPVYRSEAVPHLQHNRRSDAALFSLSSSFRFLLADNRMLSYSLYFVRARGASTSRPSRVWSRFSRARSRGSGHHWPIPGQSSSLLRVTHRCPVPMYCVPTFSGPGPPSWWGLSALRKKFFHRKSIITRQRSSALRRKEGTEPVAALKFEEGLRKLEDGPRDI